MLQSKRTSPVSLVRVQSSDKLLQSDLEVELAPDQYCLS